MPNTFANCVIKYYQKKMNFVLIVDLKERKLMLQNNILQKIEETELQKDEIERLRQSVDVLMKEREEKSIPL